MQKAWICDVGGSCLFASVDVQRVPCKGEYVTFDDTNYVVEMVQHTWDANGAAYAYVYVAAVAPSKSLQKGASPPNP